MWRLILGIILLLIGTSNIVFTLDMVTSSGYILAFTIAYLSIGIWLIIWWNKKRKRA